MRMFEVGAHVDVFDKAGRLDMCLWDVLEIYALKRSKAIVSGNDRRFRVLFHWHEHCNMIGRHSKENRHDRDERDKRILLYMPELAWHQKV